MIDLQQVEDLIKQEVKARVDAEMQTIDFTSLFGNAIQAIIQEQANVLVTNILNRMVTENRLQTMLDSRLAVGLQQKFEQQITQRVSSLISNTDIGQQISNSIASFVSDKMKRANLPDNFIPWRSIDSSTLSLDASKITGKFSSLSSGGITDNASTATLSVNNGLVTVSGKLGTGDLSVSGSAIVSELQVQSKLTVTGDFVINSPSFTRSLSSLIDNKIQEERQSWVIDTYGNAILSNGKPLITDTALSSTIVSSNLRKVGTLQSLSVTDNLSVGDTFNVVGNQVGINTDEPAGVLTLWDEETEFTIRKFSNRTVFAGSTRDSDLVLGTNGNAMITLHRDGTTNLQNVTIDDLSISVSDTPPQGSGSPGQLVIMRRAIVGQPWAYQCIGGTTWAALTR